MITQTWLVAGRHREGGFGFTLSCETKTLESALEFGADYAVLEYPAIPAADWIITAEVVGPTRKRLAEFEAERAAHESQNRLGRPRDGMTGG